MQLLQSQLYIVVHYYFLTQQFKKKSSISFVVFHKCKNNSQNVCRQCRTVILGVRRRLFLYLKNFE